MDKKYITEYLERTYGEQLERMSFYQLNMKITFTIARFKIKQDHAEWCILVPSLSDKLISFGVNNDTFLQAFTVRQYEIKQIQDALIRIIEYIGKQSLNWCVQENAKMNEITKYLYEITLAENKGNFMIDLLSFNIYCNPFAFNYLQIKEKAGEFNEEVFRRIIGQIFSQNRTKLIESIHSI